MRLKSSQKIGVNLHDGVAYGLWKDNQGRSWQDSENGLHACDDTKELMQTTKAFATMAAAFCGISFVCSLQGAQTGLGWFGMISLGLNAATAVFLIIAVGTSSAVLDQTYCDMRMLDNFDIGYAVPLMGVSAVLSLCSLAALLLSGAHNDVKGLKLSFQPTEPAA